MNNIDKIGVCSRSFSRNPTLRRELLSKFSNVKFNDKGVSLNGSSLIEFLSDCDGAIVALEYIDNKVLEHLPNLKFIGKYGVGLDKLDFDALDAHDVKLGWTPGVNATSVAELTLNLSLNIVRNTPDSNALAEKKSWKQVTGKQLSSLTVGILGLGHVGSKVACLFNAFGCNVIAHDVLNKEKECQELGIQQVTFSDLLKESDLITIHIPGNESTYHIIGSSEIEQMKDDAFIINTARGGIIDEEAVIKALNTDKLASVAFDVLEVEPPQDLEFIKHPRTFVTTHIGGSSEEAILAMGFAAIDGLSNYTNATFFKKFK
jgi:D-3-phosphoglycerate dehydrogenase